MASRSLAEYYHQATKYDPDTIARRGRQLDWANQPVPFKEYEDAPRIDLARYLPVDPAQLSDRELRRLARSEDPAEQLRNDLSHLLYFTYGVTAIVHYPDRPFYMRAAPSAGGLYPAEVYVLSRGTDALPAGLYNYQVRTHSLAQVVRADLWPDLEAACFKHPALAGARLAVVLSGVFFRSAWRYEDRAYRRILLDTGHALGNLALYAPLVDLAAVPLGGFVDKRINDVLLVPDDEEGALCVVPLLPAGAVTPDLLAKRALRSKAVAQQAVPEGRRLLALHEASRILEGSRPETSRRRRVEGEEARHAWMKFAPPIALGDAPPDWGDRLSETILKRRSTRNYAGSDFTREQLGMILAAQDGSNDLLFAPDLLETYVAVHRVAGLEPGCYHRSRENGQLRQLRFKDLTEEVQFLCLNQDLGGQAAAVVFHTADLPGAIAGYGNRAYRYLHLDAGHLGQRVNLAAIHLGLGASGIGGFFDDRVNDLLGIPESEAVVYVTTLGVPAQRGSTEAAS
ncbi:MAG: SagB/ThcOx family dehydrogenase [Candidatus Sericytochromatia bacterium]|nr:SagB/ThcOx family dehydrogenase [Candidatus Tanganyikabacteria bacterium]